jgi:hypothetical protein
VQLAHAEEPAVVAEGLRRLALRREPAQVGAASHTGDRREAAILGPVQRPEERLGREERHLGIVGDRAPAAVRGLELGDARRPEAPPDLVEPHELDRRAERVTDRAAQQTPAIHFLRPRPPHVEHRSPDPTRTCSRPRRASPDDGTRGVPAAPPRFRRSRAGGARLPRRRTRAPATMLDGIRGWSTCSSRGWIDPPPALHHD